MVKERVEHYLEAIQRLTEDRKMASTSEVASDLDRSLSSVSEMFQRLEKEGYVRYAPYQGVALTENGEKLVKKVLRKRGTLSQFLKVLGLPSDKVEDEVCNLEHLISDELEALMRKWVESHSTRKHGEKSGQDNPGSDVVPLTELREGQSGTIVSVGSGPLRRRHQGHLRRHGGRMAMKRLADMGLTPGTRVTVTKSAPFHGPVELSVRGSKLVVGRGMARMILVRVGE